MKSRWVVVLVVLFTLILIPFLIWEDRMNAFAASVLNDKASRGVVWAAVVGLLGSDILLPIPSSLVSTAAGIFLGFWSGLAASFAGLTIACAMGYALGRYAGSRLIHRFVTPEELATATEKFDRWGDGAILASRPVPMLAEASVVLAGALRRPFGRFFALCALSNLAISGVYAAVGAFSLRADAFLFSFVAAIVLPWAAMRLAGQRIRRG